MQCTTICTYDERYTSEKWYFENITRPFSIIYYSISGEAYYSYLGIEKRFERNHLYILPADKVFSLRENSNNKFYALFIHAFTTPKIDTVIDINVSEDSFVGNSLELLRKYIKDKNEIYVRTVIDMILSYLFEIMEGEETDTTVKIKNYIDKNFVKVFKNNNLSECFNYSKSYISKLFKDKYKITPKQYAQKLLLNEIVLMLYKGYSVSKIAEKLNFSTPENLSRFFKASYGLSPTEYRRKFKEYPL